MSGPRPSRKRPSAVHRRAGQARPLRHCYNKKRLFALCIVGWGLDPTAPPPGNTISRDGPRSGQDRSLQSNGKQAFSCSQNKKKRGPLCLGAARDVLM